MKSKDLSVTASANHGIFGVPCSLEDAQLILLPVPWEVTTSYGHGTSQGPDAILQASPQIDLLDMHVGNAFEAGYHMLPIPQHLLKLNETLKPLALKIRHELEESGEISATAEKLQEQVNRGCQEMVDWVFAQSSKILNAKKKLGVIGGDHSSPFGAIRAVSEFYKGHFGILHIDAHADLRESYQGFKYSHASIMNNVMNAPFKPQKLVQVAIRDYCQEEAELIQSRPDIRTFFDRHLKESLFEGESWSGVVREIITALPEQVYISFDIDGLSPEFCPHTGTPVPGGLSFDQAVYLLTALLKAKKKIVGFDLNEVAPGPQGDWDANVGARLLYKLCGLSVLTN